MRTGYVAIAIAAVVVASLDAILLSAALGARPSRGMVLVLDASLLASSLLLGVRFARRRMRLLAALFLGNLALFAVAAVLRASGIAFPPAVLFAADLYWLHLYLVTLARHWHLIVGRE